MIKHLYEATVIKIDGDERLIPCCIVHTDIVAAISFMRENGYSVQAITKIKQVPKSKQIGWSFGKIL